jgi:glyoxylase-like metal-dependent hydrolase (beta-lactamase superfamily II)
MIKIFIIKEGFARKLNDQEYDVDCSVSLIYFPEKDIGILFDTGGSWTADQLCSSLKTISKTMIIKYVICSHGHSDHIGLLSLFPSSLTVVGRDINIKNIYKNSPTLPSIKSIGTTLIELDLSSLEVFQSKESSSDQNNTIKVITTPGHTASCVSLLISSKSDMEMIIGNDGPRSVFVRKIAFVGDLWEEEFDEEYWRDLSEDFKLQESSREFIKSWCPDVIIPGHGPPFKLNK